MAVLVTGGCGYIGSATVELLQEVDEEVVVLDNLSRGHREAIPPHVSFYQGNVGDRRLVARIGAEHKIEACVHFAALAYVGESVREPVRYYENNVEQGIALLEMLLQAGVRQVVFSSSCATYGEPERIPMDEQHRQRPQNPYGWSKLFMERILESCDRAYGLRFIALRYFNAAGATARCGEDHTPEPHLIPNVLKAAQGEIPYLSVFGEDYPTPDGTPVRDYIHIRDLGCAHVQALGYLRVGGASEFINLGNGQGYSVLEVIEIARQVTGRPIDMKIEAPRPGDASHLVAQADKARRVLGWEPTFAELETIVGSAWEWYQTHPHGYGEK
jgi:UDP-glucose 4-epimerase